MKIKLLVLALSITALAACSNDAATDTAVVTPVDDTAMIDPAAPAVVTDPMATDAMAASNNPMVGGSAMDPMQDIVANASNSSDHTTLVAAVQAAGLVETLQGPGPYTVFAPTNAAFEALPTGTVDNLLKPEMKDDLSKVLTYHVVSGNVNSAALAEQIQAGNGEATLTTVQGANLIARANPAGGVTITDAQGNTANVTTADVNQSNGVIHVVDKVLMQ